jgi:TolB-like protein
MSASEPCDEPVFLFDGFRLDRRDGLSRQHESGPAEPITLGSRALDVLIALVKQHGELVTRQSLMDTVWPDMTVEVANLTVQISALRHVLDKGRAAGSCIQTVIGRGYRFLPAVTTEANIGIAPHMGSAPAMREPLLLTGPTVAVLPFDNFSKDPRWDRFCDGLVEDIITGLSRHPDLLVIARQSSSAYKGRLTDVREIGRALGARYIVEGSVQAEAGRLKVTAQLINSLTGTHVWAEHYTRDEADLFVIQEEIVNQVIAAVAGFGGSIVRAELTVARRKAPATLRAYELYLLGYEQEARLDREGTLRSIELLDAAVEADPHMSRAWIVLGWAFGNVLRNGWTDDQPTALARRREAVFKAVESDPGDSLALASLAGLLVREGDFQGACVAVERALVVGANHADSLAFLAPYVSAMLDRPDEAMVLIERSFVLNPHAPIWYYLTYIRALYFARSFVMLLEYYARLVSNVTIRALPMNTQKLFRTLALAQLGRESEAALALADLRLVDRDLRVIETEALGLCPAARELFLDGLRKARLVGLGLPDTARAK